MDNEGQDKSFCFVSFNNHNLWLGGRKLKIITYDGNMVENLAIK